MKTMILSEVLCLMLVGSVFAAVKSLPLTQAKSLTQFGITWEFDEEYPVGRFANGDYWVTPNKPGTPVVIVKITPESKSVDGNILNGSMINPKTRDCSAERGTKGNEVFQGFDSRMNAYAARFNKARPNGRNLDSTNPLRVPAGSSLISAVSYEGKPKWGGRPALNTVAILTVLATPPAPGSFRPAYCEDDKTVKFNVADLDYSRLAKLKLVGSHIRALKSAPRGNDAESLRSSCERMVARPWLDFATGPMGSYMHPEFNMSGDGAQVAQDVSEIALILNSADYTDAEKQTLMIGFVQVGIDLYGIHDGTNVVWWTWGSNGQIGHGRKFPILFAGTVLKTEAAAKMRDIGKFSISAVQPGPHTPGSSGYVSFQEDEDTFYVTAHPNSATDEQKRAIWKAGTDQDYDIFVPNPDGEPRYRLHRDDRGKKKYYGHANPGKDRDFPEYLAGPYIPGTEFDEGAGHEGMPEWAINGHSDRAYAGLSWDAPYRHTNAWYWGGFLLAAHAMGLRQAWNHDPLFDYMDRFMRIMNNNQKSAWIGKMWETYRDTYPYSPRYPKVVNKAVADRQSKRGE